MTEFHVDQRAIVVHHHLWHGKVGGIKSVQEAESRVSAIVARMASHALLEGSETSGASGAEAFAPDDQDAGTAFGPIRRGANFPVGFARAFLEAMRQSQRGWLGIPFCRRGWQTTSTSEF